MAWSQSGTFSLFLTTYVQLQRIMPIRPAVFCWTLRIQLDTLSSYRAGSFMCSDSVVTARSTGQRIQSEGQTCCCAEVRRARKQTILFLKPWHTPPVTHVCCNRRDRAYGLSRAPPPPLYLQASVGRKLSVDRRCSRSVPCPCRPRRFAAPTDTL